MKLPPAILSALFAALLFGASIPLAKLTLHSANPLLVAGMLYLGSGVGLAFARMLNRGRRVEAAIPHDALPWLLGAILTGGVVAPVLLLLGLMTTSGSAASLLLNLEAVATALIAWVAFRENVDRRVAIGFVCIFIGGVLLSLPRDGGVAFSGGVLLIVAACVCWGIDNNLTRKISAGDPSQIAMWKGLVAGVVNCGLALGLGAKLPDAKIAIGVAVIGFLGYGVSLILFVRALRDLGTARTGAYFSTAPFAGAALAFALGQGSFDWMFATAGVLMAAGVWLHLTERHEHWHAHEPMEHDHLHFHDEHHQHAHLSDDPAYEPHAHPHRHTWMRHSHHHYPDLHHRHEH